MFNPRFAWKTTQAAFSSESTFFSGRRPAERDGNTLGCSTMGGWLLATKRQTVQPNAPGATFRRKVCADNMLCRRRQRQVAEPGRCRPRASIGASLVTHHNRHRRSLRCVDSASLADRQATGVPSPAPFEPGWFGSRRVRLQDGSVVPLNMRLKDAPKLGVHQADLGDDVVSNRELHVLSAR